MDGRNPSVFLHGRRPRSFYVCFGAKRSTCCPVSSESLPAARLATWREAFLTAGQEAMNTHPLDTRDRELGRLREKLGESTMEIELLREKIGRLETSRPLAPRRSRR